MKKVIYNVLLLGSLLLSIYVIYIWLNHPEYNATPVELKLLISASFLSCLGLFIVFNFQKKSFLNYKFISFSLLLFSVVFLFGASFLLYTSYYTYVKRLETLETSGTFETTILETTTYHEDEAHTYIELKESRDLLLGYVTFLTQTARNYNPNDYVYANAIKRELIAQLSNKKGTQYYWDEILNNVYTFDSIKQSHKRGGYNIMYAFVNKMYPDEDLGDSKDMEFIHHTSVSEYWQTEILAQDRTPESITSFWGNNRAFLYTFFSKSQYDKLCKQVIDDLITIKRKVNEHPDYQEFYDAHNISDAVFLTFPDSAFVKLYEYSWPFSFWDRRYEEGNDEVVFEILKEIQTHYQN